jgi:hypothetical protein
LQDKTPARWHYAGYAEAFAKRHSYLTKENANVSVIHIIPSEFGLFQTLKYRINDNVNQLVGFHLSNPFGGGVRALADVSNPLRGALRRLPWQDGTHGPIRNLDIV